MEEKLTSGQKAANTRTNNTKADVKFLAGAYYDCATFVYNSGIDDLSIVNKQFEFMLDNFIRSGKVKPESYKKFKNIFYSVGANSINNVKDKQEFINIIIEKYNSVSVSSVTKVEAEFFNMLNNSGIKVPKKIGELLFSDFVLLLADVIDDSTFDEEAHKYVLSKGFKRVRFQKPDLLIENTNENEVATETYIPVIDILKSGKFKDKLS